MKRICSSKVCAVKQKGSLSIEAAATVPLFVLGLLTLASLLLMYGFRMKMQAALLFTAQNLSMETRDGHNVAISEVKDRVCDFLKEGKENFGFVKSGTDGLDFSASCLDEPEIVSLAVAYELVPFSDLFGILSVPVRDCCVMHAWCGYERGYVSGNFGEYVYVTKDSEVYHTDRECSHIKLNIIKTSGESIDGLRNEDGGKYHQCEICKAGKSEDVLYVTTDGDRYHSSVRCPGLRRTVRSVRLSDAVKEGLRLCTRCGK